jgi:hypothetical protein
VLLVKRSQDRFPVVSLDLFSDLFPSDRTMALGSTQPLVKMSTRNISGGKDGRCVRLTTSPPSLAECHEIWEPKPPGTPWATPGLLWDSFTLLIIKLVVNIFRFLCIWQISIWCIYYNFSTFVTIRKVLKLPHVQFLLGGDWV